MISTSFVVLHTGQAVTLVEYLFRVLAYLLAFVGVGVATHWLVHVVDVVTPENGEREGISEKDS